MKEKRRAGILRTMYVIGFFSLRRPDVNAIFSSLSIVINEPLLA